MAVAFCNTKYILEHKNTIYQSVDDNLTISQPAVYVPLPLLISSLLTFWVAKRYEPAHRNNY